MLTTNRLLDRQRTEERIHATHLLSFSTALLFVFPLLAACGVSSKDVAYSATKTAATLKQNHLIHESSPYLREHSFDPVDWYPWNDEAFQKAKKENKPILLSIGYSACHWCHVMQRESFQDKETARIMNDNFVNIKVDREERPDVDDVYMRAVQAMTGRGGWPATLFLTPELKPFYAGTYFPNKDMPGVPSFKSVLTSAKNAWSQDPARQDEVGTEVARVISSKYVPTEATAQLTDDTLSGAAEILSKNFDTTYGGIGTAPKFPVPGPLSLCMRLTASAASENQRRMYLAFISTTLDRMAYGGIHDHIAGGFCRYSTDREWHVPHFEKMLCDNALISGSYLDGYLITRKSYWAQTARDTLDFCLSELHTSDGAFFSSLDADSAGEEGAFYTFTQKQLVDALGHKDADWFAQSFSASRAGNFQPHQNLLYFTDTPESLAHRDGISLNQFWTKVAALRQKLLTERNKRPHPYRDEKAITAWNALMVSNLVKGYKVLGDEKYLEAAKQTGHFLLSKMYFNNRLHRICTDGRPSGEAFLDDYAFTVQALLDLSGVDFDPAWLRRADELNRQILEHYRDNNSGDFFFTADYQDQPLTRLKASLDSATPSATGVQVMNLCRLANITDNSLYKTQAATLLKLYSDQMKFKPLSYGSMLNALDYFVHSKTEIVLVAPLQLADTKGLRDTIFGVYAPNTNIVFVKQSSEPTAVPLLRGKCPVDDRPTVYVCHGTTCEKPVTKPAALQQMLKQLSAEHAL